MVTMTVFRIKPTEKGVSVEKLNSRLAKHHAFVNTDVYGNWLKFGEQSYEVKVSGSSNSEFPTLTRKELKLSGFEVVSEEEE